MQRILVVANPIAGRGRARRRAPRLVAALRARGLDARLELTASADELAAHAAAATPAQLDALVVAGGDGSLRTVLGHLTDPRLPLGLLPCGTANSLARELRLRRSPRRLAALIADPHLLEIGIATLRTVAPDGRATGPAHRLLCFAGAGLDAAMVHEMERRRRGRLGRLRWLGPVLAVARRLPDHRLHVRLDDGRTCDDLGEVLVARIRDFGSVFHLPAEVDLRDDHLNLLLFPRHRTAGWLRTALRGWVSGLRAGRDCTLHRCRSVTISAAEPTPVQIDGEAAGFTPVMLQMTAQRARLLVGASLPGARRSDAV